MTAWTSALLACLVLGRPAFAEEPRAPEAAELINAVLEGLLGFREMSAEELQDEVAAAGEVPFRVPVPVDYLSPRDLPRYLGEVLDDEYPEARARADGRVLEAFGLLPRGTDLRGLRRRLLEENVAGFYDDRPGRKRLYAVSEDRRLTASNQLVLSHELRHALQDQHLDTHHAFPPTVGDFDDRRLAFMSLLEGDATLVMERFLLRRLGDESAHREAGDFSWPTKAAADIPQVLHDQMVVPYVAGRSFARALWEKGGGAALRAAWSSPPESTEQVLHPEKYVAREVPRPVAVTYAPPGGTLVAEGVLGEALIRTLLGGDASAQAAAGWGGDRYRVWDVRGGTLLVWRTAWDRPEDAREFREALLARLKHVRGRDQKARDGRYQVFRGGHGEAAVSVAGPEVLMAVADEAKVLRAALAGER
jgi:hypothetical protein